MTTLRERNDWNRKIRDLVDSLLQQAGYAEDSSARNHLGMMNFDAQPESEPSCRVCGSPIGSLHMAAGNLKCGWPARVQVSDCEPKDTQNVRTPASDREALIAQHRARAESAKLRGPNYSPCISADELLKLLDMLKADAQEIARSQGQEITKNDAKRDTLRTRLNIIMGQINQLEWKTGVGGSYFETVQEQCDAIVKDFGLKKLSSHLMSLPHTWVRRNTGLRDGYEIIEPRGRYVPANQPQTSGPAQQVTCKCTEYEFCESCYKKRKAQQVAVPQGYALVPIEPTLDMLSIGDAVWVDGARVQGAIATKTLYSAMLKAAPQPAAYVPLTDAPQDLHAAIMNIPCRTTNPELRNEAMQWAYKIGHRDARHAAAELAIELAVRGKT